MFDIVKFQSRINSFPEEYMNNFDYIWRRKVEIESQNDVSILDERYIDETYRRLNYILPKWQTYRPKDNRLCLRVLKKSINEISASYNALRRFSLLTFEDILMEVLESIWHELGKVKECDGETNQYGSYSIISICKPLLLIWGQTLAFDSKVIKNMPKKYGINKHSNNWNLREWKRVMTSISKDLNQDKKVIDFMKKRSTEWYGKDTPVPYGRLLDIYYFEGS